MIDWARLRELQSDLGGEAFGEVIRLFLDETEEAVRRLAEGRDDPQRLLHFIKGDALNLGFTDLAALCSDGERRASAGATPDLAATAHCYDASRALLMEGLHAA